MSRPALFRPASALLLALAAVTGLAACGQKGPLYLPPPAPTAPAPAAAPAAEQPAAQGTEQDKDKEKNTAPASSSPAAPAAQP